MTEPIKDVDQRYQEVKKQVNIGGNGAVYDQGGQKAKHVTNLVGRTDGSRVPLEEATDEERESFYKSFPNQRPNG